MGKEMTYRYAQRGCRLVIGARRLDKLNEIKQECFKRYGNSNIKCIQLDVSVEEQAQRFIEEAAEFLGGRIDIMALCAGISAHSLFEDFQDMVPFKKVVDTNLMGCAYPTKFALKYMKKDLSKP